MTNLEIWEQDLKLLIAGDRSAWICKRHTFGRGQWVYRVGHRTLGWSLKDWSSAPTTARAAWKHAVVVAQYNLLPADLNYSCGIRNPYVAQQVAHKDGQDESEQTVLDAREDEPGQIGA
jgi:hypothetical protein